jgi:FkbM family methyltransferase
MKALIRKILSVPQRQKLRQVFDRAGKSTEKMAERCVNILPAAVRIFLKSHLQVVKKMDYPKEDIVLNISSAMEDQVRLNSCRKEPETVGWIETFKDRDVFFDVGANVGAYALVAAKYFKGKVAVYAFEPSFLNFFQLCNNIYLNHCAQTIVPFNVAFSDKTAVDCFNYRTLTVGGAMHALGLPRDDFNNPFTPVFKQTMLAFAMDDFIETFDLPVPQHIKIDVDGHEWPILQGARKILEDHQVQSVLIELVQGDTQIHDYLAQKGFALKDSFPQKESGLANCIFERL